MLIRYDFYTFEKKFFRIKKHDTFWISFLLRDNDAYNETNACISFWFRIQTKLEIFMICINEYTLQILESMQKMVTIVHKNIKLWV